MTEIRLSNPSELINFNPGTYILHTYVQATFILRVTYDPDRF